MAELISGKSTYEVKRDGEVVLGVVKLGTACNLCEHSYVDEYEKRKCLAFREGPYINEKNGRIWYSHKECFLVAKPMCVGYYSEKYPVYFRSWWDRLWRWLNLQEIHRRIVADGLDYTYQETHK